VLALLLVAGSLGMDNFAASIAIGLSGVNRSGDCCCSARR
jgi:putative Mn2+ efflux pump MntP